MDDVVEHEAGNASPWPGLLCCRSTVLAFHRSSERFHPVTMKPHFGRVATLSQMQVFQFMDEIIVNDNMLIVR